MHTYGGPGSQVVVNAWGGKGALWYHYLAERGYVIFLCDNRGTGACGRAFKKITYLKLGDYEVRDQIAGARYLGSLPFVDPKRIAIWGWSYGGYMAANLILKGADVFRAAIAVAPVTDWKLYDTIYTERYMRRPCDNPEGYREGSPVHFAHRLKGRFLLLHGTMDDNVHFQNAARLASALQDKGKQFETMFYPGRHHGIENRHLHLYRAMTDFLRRAL
jgi:dipeptidyl-peptidase-4